MAATKMAAAEITAAEALGRVLWIGGAPDAGETSVARELANRYGVHHPELVAPLLTSPRQAIWLVPTEAFKRTTYAGREARSGKGAQRAKMSDSARARENHIGRDLLIGQLVLDQARALGLAENVFVVDGSEPLEATVARVIAHFQPLLPPPLLSPSTP
jgi:hypothetical protein